MTKAVLLVSMILSCSVSFSAEKKKEAAKNGRNPSAETCWDFTDLTTAETTGNNHVINSRILRVSYSANGSDTPSLRIDFDWIRVSPSFESRCKSLTLNTNVYLSDRASSIDKFNASNFSAFLNAANIAAATGANLAFGIGTKDGKHYLAPLTFNHFNFGITAPGYKPVQ